MRDILIHATNIKTKILFPHKIPGGDICICFSLNKFISYFGEYNYLFWKSELERDFKVKELSPSGSIRVINKISYNKEYRFTSDFVDREFRIYQPIEIDIYCIGIIQNFNYMKGILEKKFQDKIVEKEIINLSK
jgi:hypothetical protein